MCVCVCERERECVCVFSYFYSFQLLFNNKGDQIKELINVDTFPIEYEVCVNERSSCFLNTHTHTHTHSLSLTHTHTHTHVRVVYRGSL